MKKIKVAWEFTSCDKCGGSGDFTVVTKSEHNNYFYDDDEVICNHCGNKGCVDIVSEEGLDVFWSL